MTAAARSEVGRASFRLAARSVASDPHKNLFRRSKTKMKRNLFVSLAAAAAFMLLPVAVKADPFTFTLSNPTQTASPGQTVTFSGTLGNGGQPRIYLNGTSFSVPPGVSGVDDSPFFSNAPAFLDPGQSTGVIALFQVTISPSFTGNSIIGSFSILGGPNPNSQNTLGTQDYRIIVQQQAPIPEPATMLLLGTGLAGIAAVRRQRRKSA